MPGRKLPTWEEILDEYYEGAEDELYGYGDPDLQ